MLLKRFPAIEPYEHGMLAVGDGQHLYWETCGNPNGKPAVVLHGGPGSGCTVGMRRSFDPGAYWIVLLELLRAHLGIDRRLVWGASWGTTLALAYAQRHPQRVSELVLASIALTRPADIRWLYHETGRFFPEQWARFRDGMPEQERDGDIVAAYHRLLNEDPDPQCAGARRSAGANGKTRCSRSKPTGCPTRATPTPPSAPHSRES